MNDNAAHGSSSAPYSSACACRLRRDTGRAPDELVDYRVKKKDNTSSSMGERDASAYPSRRPMGIPTFNGVVYPSQTDAMGHMTVQYYIAAFDQAMWHLVSRLGYDPEWRNSRDEGWADVRYEIDFRAELRVGDLYTVKSEVVDLGRTSLKSKHRLLARSGELAAELLMTSVYFHLKERKSIPIPDSIRSGVRALTESPDATNASA